MSNLIHNDNITFFLHEKNNDKNKNNENDIQKMMEVFNEEIDTEYSKSLLITENIEDKSLFIKRKNDDIINEDQDNMEYFLYKYNYGNDEVFYEQEYTIKDLLKICKYYGLDKNIKTSKCKKQDIIETIVYFESLPENFEIVQKRNRMWAYITELLCDPKMKKFVIWS